MLRIKPDQKQRVTLTVNGKLVSGYAQPRLLLTDFLRHEMVCTGHMLVANMACVVLAL